MKTSIAATLLAICAACGEGSAPVAEDAGATNPGPPAPVPQPPAPPPAPRVENQVLLMLEDPDDLEDIDEFLEEVGDEFGEISIERIGTTGFFILTVPDDTDLDRLFEDLDDDLRVVVSEPDYLGDSPEGGPGGLATFGSDLLDSLPNQAAFDRLDLVAAHAVSTGAGVVVAVVDTGVAPGHPAFAGRLTPPATWFDFVDRDTDPTDRRNFADDDGDGLVDEQYGHGTFVASLILAVAPDARILPVRALNDEGFGTSSTVASGIVWAVDMGAAVINLSVDIPGESEAVKDAIEYASDNGVLVVAAAGNGGAGDPIYPARLRNVLAVAASDAWGVLAPFSNHGERLALVAPGLDVVGAVPEDLNPHGTARWSGTSFAAPVVAGTAALVYAAFPGIDRRDVMERVATTALPVDDLNPELAGELGSGLVQPAAAVD